MLLCCGWAGFSPCHRKYSSTWASTTTFLNHIPLDCNTSPQPCEADLVLIDHNFKQVVIISWLKESSLTQRTGWSWASLAFPSHMRKDESETESNPLSSKTGCLPVVLPLLLFVPVNLLCQTKCIFIEVVHGQHLWGLELPELYGTEWDVLPYSWMDCPGEAGVLLRPEAVDLLITDKKQDENLWKKMINGIWKWIVRR